MNDAEGAESAPGSDKPGPELPIPSHILEDIPKERRAELRQFANEITYVERFSGPIPPPEVLNQYDGEVQRAIVNEAVENRKHRTGMQSRSQALLFVWDLLTLGAAFVLAYRLIDGSIGIIQQGQIIEGLLGIGATVSVVVGAFLLRNRNRRSERGALIESSSESYLPDEGSNTS